MRVGVSRISNVGSTLINTALFKAKCTVSDMGNPNKTVQIQNENGVFNRGTLDHKSPRPTAKGKERIQKGKEFMPDWSITDMEEYLDGLPDGKERNIVLACIKRKERKTIKDIAHDLRKPPGTIRDWLARGRERGLYDLADRKPGGRSPILNDSMVETVREWISKPTKEFGYARKRWQRGMIHEQIRKRFGIECSSDTVRRIIHHIRYSFRKSRPAPHKSAPEEEQKEFKEKTADLLGKLAIVGYVIMALDEASCMIGGWNGYGWLPVGGHETIPTSWSKKSVRLIGVLGQGWFHIAIVDSTNSDTLKEFLDTVREKTRKIAIVMDNVSYHKSVKTRQYVKDSGGDIVCAFLPKYTPQLNPIETLWRDLKRALAGSYFESIDELKATIIEIVNNSELNPPKLMEYMMPDGAKIPDHLSCTIQDMTSATCKVAAA